LQSVFRSDIKWAMIYAGADGLQSKYGKISFLVTRSVKSIVKNIKDFVKHIETASGRQVEKSLSDNSRECQSTVLLEALGEMNVEKISTVPYCLQSNRTVERMNYSICNKIGTFCLFARLPKYLWGELARCAKYIMN
jgi:hypothetical protein